MSREIVPRPASVQPVSLEEANDLRTWLAELPQGKFAYVLAHADDGVIWGKVEQGVLIIAQDVGFNSPPLRLETLQQVRVFNKQAEWLLWRNGTTGEWAARVIEDREDGKTYAESFDEDDILWGDQVTESIDGFSLMQDGAQGLRHAVPLPLRVGIYEDAKKRAWRPLRLKIRHYVQADEYGFVRIAASRLVKLYEEKAK